ncbi:MAG: hypothetical protein AB1509_11335 [Chloroflexota bacterium]
MPRRLSGWCKFPSYPKLCYRTTVKTSTRIALIRQMAQIFFEKKSAKSATSALKMNFAQSLYGRESETKRGGKTLTNP